MKYQQIPQNHRWFYPQGRQTGNEAYSALRERAQSRIEENRLPVEDDPKAGPSGRTQSSKPKTKLGRPPKQTPFSQGTSLITKFFLPVGKQKIDISTNDMEEDGSSVEGGSELEGSFGEERSESEDEGKDIGKDEESKEETDENEEAGSQRSGEESEEETDDNEEVGSRSSGEDEDSEEIEESQVENQLRSKGEYTRGIYSFLIFDFFPPLTCFPSEFFPQGVWGQNIPDPPK